MICPRCGAECTDRLDTQTDKYGIGYTTVTTYCTECDWELDTREFDDEDEDPDEVE